MNAPMSSSHFDLWMIAGWTMIHFLWLGTLVGLAALLSRWLLRRASANMRYAVALSCLAMLTALPIVIAMWLHEYSQPVQAADRPLQNDAASQVASSVQGGTIELKSIEPTLPTAPGAIEKSDALISVQPAPRTAPLTDPAIAATTTDSLSLAVSAINASVEYLPWLWLIGTPITFALTATGLLGARRLRRASRLVTDGPIVEALARLAASLRLARHVTIAVCDRIAAPVLIGILRPVILLPPAALTGYSPDEIEMVLLHELAHVRRWDNLVNLTQRLVESLLFFHPAVWLISSWVRRERESCCDALVVTRTDRPHAYAELLVALAAQMPRSVLFHPAASSAMAAGPLRSRIRRILQLDDDPMLISGKSFALVLGTLLVAGTLAALYVPKIGRADETATNVSESAKSEKLAEEAISVAAKELLARFDIDATEALNANDAETMAELFSDNFINPVESKNYLIPAKQQKALEAALDAIKNGPLSKHIRFKDKWDDQHAKIEITAPKAALAGFFDPLIQSLRSPQATKTTTRDAETELLLREIADMQKQKRELVSQLYQSRTDYQVMKSRLDDPDVEKSQKPTLSEQQLTKEYKIRSAAMQEQLNTLQKSLDEHLKTLKDRAAQSSALESRDTVTDHPRTLAEIERDYVPNPPVDNEDQRRQSFLKWMFTVTDTNPLVAEIYLVSSDAQAKLRSGIEELAKQPGWELQWKIVADWKPDVNQVRIVTTKMVHEVLAAELKSFTAPAHTTSGQSSSKFPSLEDQKLADVAWKRLGVELEPIGEADLKRVKALGYDGGLKVVDGNLPANGILVGLHAWPTTNLKDVAQILEREDALDLNPLKFYVVCSEMASDPQHPQGIPKDVVRTGRIIIQGGGGLGRNRDNQARRTPTKQDDKTAPLGIVAVPNVEQVKVADRYVAPSAPTYSVPAPVGLNQVIPGRGRGGMTLVPAEAVFVAYDIPADLKDTIRQYLGRTDTRSMSDDRGRWIVQATRAWHDHFAALLKATPKWRDPAAAKDRAAIPIVMRKAGNEDIVEWRVVGLSLKPAGEKGSSAPSSQRGVEVAEVAPGSPAAWADIHPGDWLDSVGSFNAGTMSEVQALLKALGEGLHAKKVVRVRFNRQSPTGSRDVTADFTLGPEDIEAKTANPPIESKTRPAEIDKANLRYEGKTFPEWRTAWQAELSLEKRTEAVKALATFGARGYGPEASEAILNVAQEYDSLEYGDGPEGKFGNAVRGSLTARIPKKDWLPLLRNRYDAEPQKWVKLALDILPQCWSKDEHEQAQIQQFLLLLTQDENSEISRRATEGFARRFPESDELKKHPPKVFDLLLHGDPKQQTDIRKSYYQRLDGQSSGKTILISTFVDLLNDDAKKADHVAAIRALGAVGRGSLPESSENVRHVLRAIVDKGPRDQQIAAAVALNQLVAGNAKAFGMPAKIELRYSDGKKLTPEEIDALLIKESETAIGQAPQSKLR